MTLKRLYLVKREVLATSVIQALRLPGKVYEIQLAEDKFQPEPKKGTPGFDKKKKT